MRKGDMRLFWIVIITFLFVMGVILLTGTAVGIGNANVCETDVRDEITRLDSELQSFIGGQHIGAGSLDPPFQSKSCVRCAYKMADGSLNVSFLTGGYHILKSSVNGKTIQYRDNPTDSVLTSGCSTSKFNGEAQYGVDLERSGANTFRVTFYGPI